jgi:hypothetical protein
MRSGSSSSPSPSAHDGAEGETGGQHSAAGDVWRTCYHLASGISRVPGASCSASNNKKTKKKITIQTRTDPRAFIGRRRGGAYIQQRNNRRGFQTPRRRYHCAPARCSDPTRDHRTTKPLRDTSSQGPALPRVVAAGGQERRRAYSAAEGARMRPHASKCYHSARLLGSPLVVRFKNSELLVACSLQLAAELGGSGPLVLVSKSHWRPVPRPNGRKWL